MKVNHPTSPTEHQLIEQLCGAHESVSVGLPDGCMPGSMCALAHQHPYTASLFVTTGVLLGFGIAWLLKKKLP